MLRKNLLLGLCGLFALSQSAFSSAEATSTDDASLSILVLNELTLEELGVSLPALAVLATWTADSYQPADYLIYSGRMALIRELESGALVKVREVMGLPDGTKQSTKLITLVPTVKGIEIVAAFKVITEDVKLSRAEDSP